VDGCVFSSKKHLKKISKLSGIYFILYSKLGVEF